MSENNNKRPINIAVFEFESNGEYHTCEGSTYQNKDDAILDTLRSLQDNDIDGDLVTRIYSEWKMSPETEKIIISKCPNAKITYSFTDGDEDKFEKEMKKLYSKRKWWKFWS